MSKKMYITLEVDDKGTPKVKKFGDVTDKAFDKLKKNARAGATQAGKMERAWKTSIDHLKRHWKKYAVAGVAAVYGVTKIISGAITKMKEYVGLANVQEAAERKLGAVLKATGNAAGYNLDQLKKMASGMQSVTTVGDEVTLSGMAILATFKQIRGEGFERATKAAMDMSAVMGQDLKSSMVMIGKAVNDPITGMSMLTRVGVTFTQQQKDMARQLQESGDMAGAQNIILKELESQFGGTAAALRKDFGGSVIAAGNALGDTKEEMGFLITKNQFFIKIIHLAEKQFIAWGEKIKENREYLQDLLKAGVLKLIEGIKLTGRAIMFAWDAVSLLWKLFSAIPKGVLSFFTNTADETKRATKETERLSTAIGKLEPPSQTSFQKFWSFLGKWGKDIIGVFAFMGKSVGGVFGVMVSDAIATVKMIGKEFLNLGTIIWKTLSFDFAGAKKAFVGLGTTAKDYLKEMAVNWTAYEKTIYTSWSKMLSDMGKVQEKEAKKYLTTEQIKNKNLLAYMDDLIKKHQKAAKDAGKIHKKEIKTYLTTEQIKNKNLLAYMDDLLKEHKATSREKIKITENEAKAVADYAKESTKIYERLYDDVQKLDLGDYAYNLKLLAQRYTNYKDHLEALARQDSKYSGGVQLLDQWMTAEKEKLWDDWARKHGTVLDRLTVRWHDYQKEAISINSVAYDAISAGAANLQGQISDNLFLALTGDMDKLRWDWDALWKSMVRSVTDAVARMAVEAAIGTAVSWMAAIFAAKGIWDVEGDEVPVIAHKGEMIVPAKIAEKIRGNMSASGYGSDFSDLGKKADDIGGRVKQGLVKGTTETYAGISATGILATLHKDISPEQLIRGMTDPNTLAISTLVGGVPQAAVDAMGLEGKASDIGQFLGTVGMIVAGVPGIIAAMLGRPVGAFIGDAIGDALNVRGFENLRDALESDLGYFSGRRSFKDFRDGMKEAGYKDDKSINKWLSTIGFGAIQAIEAGWSGSSRTGSGSHRGSFGGHYSGRGSTGAGGGHSVSGGYSGMGGGSPSGASPMRYGGLARGPASGYPMELHGNEEVVPLDEPYLSKFRNAVGADPDKIAAAIVNKINVGSRGGDLHITVEVGGEEFDAHIEEISDDVRVKAERRNMGTRRMYS